MSEIESFPVGAQFFQALQNAGKQIGVKYMGPNQNQAAGGVRGYVVLRQKHDAGNAVEFGQELTGAIQRFGRTTKWLGHELRNKAIATWQGGVIVPFSGYQPYVITAQVDNWAAGLSLPSRDEMDALALVLKDHLTAGAGVATRIYFDPHKEIVNGQRRPPHCGLFHELVHAYYNALGKQLGREDSLNEDNGGRLFELMAVGLGPFAQSQFSENKFRQALAVPLRMTYP